MATINRHLHRILTLLSISVFVLLVLDVTLGVVSRYVFGNQIRWTEELATFLLVWQVYCGAAIAYRDNAHLGINLLTDKLDPDARRIALLVMHSVVFVFVVAVMVWGGAQLTLERFQSGQMMSTLGIEKAWLYLSVPLNGFFMAMFTLDKLVELFQPEAKKEGEVA